jgi:hypothetical protein
MIKQDDFLVIYKYELALTEKQVIQMPDCAEILSVQIQNGGIFLWALVNPNYKNKDVLIAIYGTGNPIYRTNETYISTCQLNGFVWHIFRLEQGE